METKELSALLTKIDRRLALLPTGPPLELDRVRQSNGMVNPWYRAFTGYLREHGWRRAPMGGWRYQSTSGVVGSVGEAVVIEMSRSRA